MRRAKLYAFVIPFIIYTFSPLIQTSDSKYSLLLTQNIIDHASLDMSKYKIRLDPSPSPYGTIFKYEPYHFEIHEDHVYYLYPIGNSIFAMPFVKLFNLFGVSAVTVNGSYDPISEAKMQKVIASFLAAGTIWMLFLVAAHYLSAVESFVIALGAAFGTPIYSTASSGLWSHTWSVVIGATILLLLVNLQSGKNVNEFYFGSLLAWSYFVRPTNMLMIIFCLFYLFTFETIRVKRLLISFGLWLSGFFIYSWCTYGKLLPTYYTMNNFNLQTFFSGLAGVTFSPARGLFVYSPIFLLTLFLSLKHFRSLVQDRLFILSVVIVFVNITAISAFKFWWGGSCYGPRYLTDIIPWLIYISIVSARHYLITTRNSAHTLFAILLFTLIGVSILNTFPGTFYFKYFNWYDPVVQNGQFNTDILWDWKKAHFPDLMKVLVN